VRREHAEHPPAHDAAAEHDGHQERGGIQCGAAIHDERDEPEIVAEPAQ
jgi:hypothetical protein